MHLLNRLPFARIELVWDQVLSGSALNRTRQLRGALAHAFADDDLFHQYDAAGRPLYRYPRIQYRWEGGRGVVIGWLEATSRLLALPWLDLQLDLGGDRVYVADAILVSRSATFGISPKLERYYLASPVLLFNQDNFPRYAGMDALVQQQERDRLLIAQILIALRALGVEFPVQLYAAFISEQPRNCRFKQQHLLGFSGGFVTNAILPDGFAFGHAVSHGYGWIVPLQ